MEAQQDEASRLRQALMDAWASRSDETPQGKLQQSATAIGDLNEVEQELQWLARQQQENAQEVHRMQHLESQKGSLQRKFRALSEEKAALHSARVDLGNAGGMLRETIASQSEGFVRRVDDLEQQKRTTHQDRAKLLNECADLQAQLDKLAPEMGSITDIEAKHCKLEQDRHHLSDESQRLRDVNAALGVLLMGDLAPQEGRREDGDATNLAQGIMKVLQLQRRLNERQGAHATEKQKLVDRIWQMDRQAAPHDPSMARDQQPGQSNPDRRGGTTSSSGEGLSSIASSTVSGALRGGLDRLRDSALNAVL